MSYTLAGSLQFGLGEGDEGGAAGVARTSRMKSAPFADGFS